MKRNMKISMDTVATAMEMRSEKIPWKKIGTQFDMHWYAIRCEVRKAKHSGFAAWGYK
jgi:hypothetical protein